MMAFRGWGQRWSEPSQPDACAQSSDRVQEGFRVASCSGALNHQKSMWSFAAEAGRLRAQQSKASFNQSGVGVMIPGIWVRPDEGVLRPSGSEEPQEGLVSDPRKNLYQMPGLPVSRSPHRRD